MSIGELRVQTMMDRRKGHFWRCAEGSWGTSEGLWIGNSWCIGHWVAITDNILRVTWMWLPGAVCWGIWRGAVYGRPCTWGAHPTGSTSCLARLSVASHTPTTNKHTLLGMPKLYNNWHTLLAKKISVGYQIIKYYISDCVKSIASLVRLTDFWSVFTRNLFF